MRRKRSFSKKVKEKNGQGPDLFWETSLYHPPRQPQFSQSHSTPLTHSHHQYHRISNTSPISPPYEPNSSCRSPESRTLRSWPKIDPSRSGKCCRTAGICGRMRMLGGCSCTLFLRFFLSFGLRNSDLGGEGRGLYIGGVSGHP